MDGPARHQEGPQSPGEGRAGEQPEALPGRAHPDAEVPGRNQAAHDHPVRRPRRFRQRRHDPARIALGPLATATQVEELRQEMGLNDPLYVQFFDFVGGYFNFAGDKVSSNFAIYQLGDFTSIFSDGFESGDTSAWSAGVGN